MVGFVMELGEEGGVLLEVAAGCHLEVGVWHGAEGVITHEGAEVVGEAVSVAVGGADLFSIRSCAHRMYLHI